MQLLTFQDTLDRLTSFVGGNAQAANVQEVRQSIIDSYNEFVVLRDWQFYNALARINFVAPVSSTCQFDGTYFVIDSDSWPSWAAGAIVQIGMVGYRIMTRYSDTQLIPDPSFTPAANIDTGTTFTIYQNTYDLPDDFRSMADPLVEAASIWTTYRPYEDVIRLDRYQMQAAGNPFYWTLAPDPYRLGRMAVIVFPHPDQARTFDIPYTRRGRDLVVTGADTMDCTGTVAVSSGVVTGTSTQFNQQHVGAVMRIASNATKPTGAGGTNRYLYQARVKSVASATSLTLDDATITGISGKGYVLSDPVDVAGYMFTAFLDLCRVKISVSKSMASLRNAQSSYAQSLEIAKAADSQNRGRRTAYDGDTYPYRRLARMPRGPDQS